MNSKAKLKRLLQLEPVPWDLQLKAQDLLEKGPQALFGRIPIEKVMADLKHQGILERLEQRGYRQFTPHLTHESAFDESFRLYGEHPQAEHPCLLVDVRTHLGELRSPDDQQFYRSLVWEWISFQDPMRTFPPGVEPLPGQTHPGLGLFRVFTAMMLDYVRQIGMQALVAVPEYFHNAVLYWPHFRFFQAEHEGRFLAMRRDLLPLGLARASRLLEQGRVRCGESQAAWTPSEQVDPLVSALASHFESTAYAERVARVREQERYEVVD